MMRAAMASSIGQPFLHQPVDHRIGLRAEIFRRHLQRNGDAAMMALPERAEIGDGGLQPDLGQPVGAELL